MNQQMKKQWEQLTARIDALSLRERGIMMLVIAFAIIFGADSLLIEPQFIKQKNISAKMKQDQLKTTVLQIEIAQRVAGMTNDPDAELKRRVASAQLQIAQIDHGLQDLQKNLVRPEKISALLENMLKRNRQLQLVSLKNLPATNVLDEIGSAQDGNAKAAHVVNSVDQVAQGAIYKHEVEIVVQGNYLDMLRYLRELESLPEQVYWSKGNMTVIDYPKASLSLTLFTLSLEKTWLNL